MGAEMQAYGSSFARVYNAQWGWFARDVAPRILDLYTRTAHGEARHPVLDLCCGTGQLAHLFWAPASPSPAST
jgi:ubiquinone/menaquinone biosynthesis C-methylase UbiE